MDGPGPEYRPSLRPPRFSLVAALLYISAVCVCLALVKLVNVVWLSPLIKIPAFLVMMGDFLTLVSIAIYVPSHWLEYTLWGPRIPGDRHF